MSEALVKAAVAAAVDAAPSVPNLTYGQINDIAANLPSPQALESLWPQLGRQVLVALGGVIVAKGWISSEDWALYSGALLVIAPIAWRVWTTLYARHSAKP